MMLTVNSLSGLKQILEDFRSLSGLSCNLEKSFAMHIGNTEEALYNKITELGFSFVNRLKLLGFTLQNYGDVTAANFEVITNKLENISRFWERFNLSIIGKLSIYKSLMLPQINYVATIPTPCDDTIKRIEQITENFVAKGLNIGGKKLYKTVEQGGVGMFPLNEFVASLQCAWIKRSFTSVTDNW